uniref:Uncharacterized protein n=1 Tax=Chromera velia CCMP2878 TaxID=1169474 RepID=A0A0G4FL83_9ALVE|eukprot:Cvel_17598.t1-p1 / transcript=Cvel_17598.t1 / gene=Cvel_17598 / organism=Chromera_velia_CCMP2878 / gene_product=hypothetical protein / transcript_product=hypothetical protein / location=Cvel_scaffold1415:29956-30366(-) / protein_length=137 / sequence_SO=supercontig / SO=protein_coding / is_pseudo=false
MPVENLELLRNFQAEMGHPFYHLLQHFHLGPCDGVLNVDPHLVPIGEGEPAAPLVRVSKNGHSICILPYLLDDVRIVCEAEDAHGLCLHTLDRDAPMGSVLLGTHGKSPAVGNREYNKGNVVGITTGDSFSDGASEK